MIRVGVLRGGSGAHYGTSLSCGAHLLCALPRDQFAPVDIYVDAAGVWHVGGRPVSISDLREKIDVVWNMLQDMHDFPAFSKIASDLHTLGLPRIGVQPTALRAAVDKREAKDALAKLGLRTPRGVYVESWGEGDREETIASVVGRIAHDFSPPWIVSPITSTPVFGPMRAKTRHELFDILLNTFDLSLPVLIEEEVLGRTASVITVPGFRGQKFYTFVPSGHVPGRDKHSSGALQEAARTAHVGLALGHYSRIEAVLDRKGTVHITQIETMPSFAADSDLHAALKTVGATVGELVGHFIATAQPEKD